MEKCLEQRQFHVSIQTDVPPVGLVVLEELRIDLDLTRVSNSEEDM